MRCLSRTSAWDGSWVPPGCAAPPGSDALAAVELGISFFSSDLTTDLSTEGFPGRKAIGWPTGSACETGGRPPGEEAEVDEVAYHVMYAAALFVVRCRDESNYY